VKQLQKFKDDLDELESAAPEVSPLEELMRREMHRHLQDSRSRQQDVIPVCGQPLQYNTYGFQQGMIELGHPLPLKVSAKLLEEERVAAMLHRSVLRGRLRRYHRLLQITDLIAGGNVLSVAMLKGNMLDDWVQRISSVKACAH
jgi:hypothetical protein